MADAASEAEAKGKEMEKTIAELKVGKSALEKEVSELKGKIVEQDKKLQEKEAALKEKQEKIAQQDKKLSEQDELIKEQKEKIAQLQEIQKLHDTIDEANSELLPHISKKGTLRRSRPTAKVSDLGKGVALKSDELVLDESLVHATPDPAEAPPPAAEKTPQSFRPKSVLGMGVMPGLGDALAKRAQRSSLSTASVKEGELGSSSGAVSGLPRSSLSGSSSAVKPGGLGGSSGSVGGLKPVGAKANPPPAEDKPTENPFKDVLKGARRGSQPQVVEKAKEPGLGPHLLKKGK